MHRYAITDRTLLAAGPAGPEAALAAQVFAWAGADVAWVQLREKDLPADELIALTRTLAASIHAKSSATRLLVNGLPAELALANGAAGVHLPGDTTAEAITAARHVGACVSVSCHTLDEIAAAREGGADAVLWAPVFGKAVQGSNVLAGTGLAALGAASQAASPVPVFALGGVTAENAQSCLQAGAAGVAGIRLFHGQGWREI
jgi:thiamine-phosphate pyrophosphorylase